MKKNAALAPALARAASMVARVAAGRSLSTELEQAADEDGSVARSALIDLTHGTLRRYGRVQAIVRLLSRRGQPDALLEALLWCALYAIDSARYSDYTAVNQAVQACGYLEKWSAKGYVNALLRSYLRERQKLEAQLLAAPESRYQHPAWWIEKVRAAYPEGWEQVLAAGNTHPPMCLRVNRRRTSAAQYLQRLAGAGIAAKALGEAAVLLERPLPLERVPGFSDGEVSVQDVGAQRAARCLQLSGGQRVLDACAAPGGKSAHILESADIALTALDADAARCARIARNFERLGLSADLRVADCTRLDAWWNGEPFERILADVPCSASGVVRRHPDIKWLRREPDLGRFAERQAAILQALWQVLAPGGKLLYVTCSVFPVENEELVSGFLSTVQDAGREPLADASAAQWLPGAEHDGFYYALITKQA